MFRSRTDVYSTTDHFDKIGTYTERRLSAQSLYVCNRASPYWRILAGSARQLLCKCNPNVVRYEPVMPKLN